MYSGIAPVTSGVTNFAGHCVCALQRHFLEPTRACHSKPGAWII